MDSPQSGSLTDDLNSRARLRAAAISRFARDGFGASLRSIASDAGLSAASVIKQFGSKEQLHAECDAHVLAVIRETKRQFMGESNGDPSLLLLEMSRIKEYGSLVGYTLRSIMAGGNAGREYFENLVHDAYIYLEEGVDNGIITPSRAPQARARYLTSASIGSWLLEASINPDVDFNNPGEFLEVHMNRVLFPALESLTEGVFADRQLLDNYLEHVDNPADATATE